MDRRKAAAERRRLGLSQEALARKLGISTIMVSSVERGVRSASDDLAARWVAYLKDAVARAGKGTR